MRWASLASLVALVAVSAVSALDRSHAINATFVPGRYIVEFDNASNLQSSPLKREVSPHETLYEEMKARDVSFTVAQEYNSNVFVGASVQLTSDKDLASIANITGVIRIIPVRLLTLQEGNPNPDGSNWPTGATPQNLPNGATSPTVLSSPSAASPSCTAPVSAPSASTGFGQNGVLGVDTINAAGNKGKGVKIAIIDGGVDYTIPALGGCFGPGYKVAGGYDYVDGDSDPLDQCYFHGTFIAGIIAANNNSLGIPGVAPDASLYSYRVFNCQQQSSDDVIMAAMLQAQKDGVNIINLSLGEQSGWTESALSVTASRLVNAGVVVVASAGNSGAIGPYYSQAPAAGRGVISAGSVNSTINVAQNATVVGATHAPIRYYWKAFPAATYKIWTYTDGSNGCTLPPANLDLSPYVVIVRQTTQCTTTLQAQNAYARGNRAILVIQNTDTDIPFLYSIRTNLATISKTDGDYLLSTIPAGSNTGAVSLTFGFRPAPQENTVDGGVASYFTNIGPSNDMYLTTQISAPGSNILSIVPAYLGDYSIQSGTSWSAPYISGIAALYLAANPGASPKAVRQAIESSGKPAPVTRGGSELKTAAQTGAGNVNAVGTLNPGVTVSPSQLLLNDTANFNGYQWITITNTGNSFKTFKLTHVPAGTMLTLDASNNQSTTNYNGAPVPQVSNAANVQFSLSTVPLLPGWSLPILVQISAPSGLDPKTFPVYSGFIKVTGGAKNLHIPYMGVAAKMLDHPVWDNTGAYSSVAPDIGLPILPVTVDQNGNVQTPGSVYDYSTTNGVEDYPAAVWRQAGGTRFATLDLVDANANLGFVPNWNSKRAEVGQFINSSFWENRSIRKVSYEKRAPNSLSGLISWWCQVTQNKGIGCARSGNGGTNTYAQVPIVGNLYELDYVPRATAQNDGNDFVYYTLDPPIFANGSIIPNGNYRFMLRGLKVNGDITQQSDYDTWVGTPFTIKYAAGVDPANA